MLRPTVSLLQFLAFRLSEMKARGDRLQGQLDLSEVRINFSSCLPLALLPLMHAGKMSMARVRKGRGEGGEGKMHAVGTALGDVLMFAWTNK